MTDLKPEYFFPESLLSDVKKDQKLDYEKIKLDFSIMNADIGAYSFQVKLNDSQAIDFISEVKQANPSRKSFSKSFLFVIIQKMHLKTFKLP